MAPPGEGRGGRDRGIADRRPLDRAPLLTARVNINLNTGSRKESLV